MITSTFEFKDHTFVTLSLNCNKLQKYRHFQIVILLDTLPGCINIQYSQVNNLKWSLMRAFESFAIFLNSC